MTTYRGRRLDMIQAADGWHAYVDMREVADGATCKDALAAACEWIDQECAEDARKGRPLRLVLCEPCSFRGGTGTT